MNNHTTSESLPSKESPAKMQKFASGIEGFDDITCGGLPFQHSTLLMGGPGCGKTVLALQLVVGGAKRAIPGLFVTFEESVQAVKSNAHSFGWDVDSLQKDLFFLHASIQSDTIKSGPFDLTGLLAALAAKASEIHAQLIVFDAIDVLLSLLDDPKAESRELYRIHEWLNLRKLTGILTTKIVADEPASAQRYGFMPFMVDCAILLSQRVAERVAVRSMRILKYRGSSHVLNEVPFVIGTTGIEVGSANGKHPEPQPFEDRVSTGVEAFDDMLSGGFYRGTNALISGSSGAGKSMLAGNFINAACGRNERALFISLDENSRDVARDLDTINIHLAPHLASGLLRMEAIRSAAASSEEHFMSIKRMIRDHQPRCLAVDPLSALTRVGGDCAARSVAERLIYLCRNAGITALFTSAIEEGETGLSGSSFHVSSASDSWIQLTYSMRAGEWNRAISIIKSRGSKHSNQLRELIFSKKGISLAEPYSAGGEVLMGSMRVEKEAAVNAEAIRVRREAALQRRRRP